MPRSGPPAGVGFRHAMPRDQRPGGCLIPASSVRIGFPVASSSRARATGPWRFPSLRCPVVARQLAKGRRSSLLDRTRVLEETCVPDAAAWGSWCGVRQRAFGQAPVGQCRAAACPRWAAPRGRTSSPIHQTCAAGGSALDGAAVPRGDPANQPAIVALGRWLRSGSPATPAPRFARHTGTHVSVAACALR